MSIFTNYDNIDSEYIPNNISKKEVEEEVVNNKPPRLVYNAKKEFIGYCWYGEERFTFDITIDTPVEDMKDKTLEFSISDFRSNIIIQTETINNNTVTFTVDDEVSSKLPCGSYRGIVKCKSQDAVEFKQVFSIAIL